MTNAKGQLGEQLVATWLQTQGWRILHHRWHCRWGEIDLITYRDVDGKNNSVSNLDINYQLYSPNPLPAKTESPILAFVEVKTRRTPLTEDAFAAMTPRKQQRLIKAVHLYLAQAEADDTAWRVDVIGVALPDDGPPHIEHVEDALGW